MIKGYIKLLDKEKGLIEFKYNGKYFTKSLNITIHNNTNVLNKWFWGGDGVIACISKTNEIIPDLNRGEQITINGKGFNLTAPNMYMYLTGSGKLNLGSIETIFCI